MFYRILLLSPCHPNRWAGLKLVIMFRNGSKEIVTFDVTPCGLVGRYQRFGETYCFHIQGWYLSASPHGLITQRNIDITAVRTSNLTFRIMIHKLKEMFE
jgi:hypothetical protein